MKRAALPFVSLALGSIVLSAVHGPTFGRAGRDPVQHFAFASGSLAHAFALDVPRTARSPRDSDYSATLQRIAEHGTGTYIDEVLMERDSSVIHWPNRDGVPLGVWVQPQADIRGFTASYASRVRAAFVAWNAVRLPVRFSFVADSAAADVHVTWIDHFEEPISGRTRWAHDDDGAITDANIVLAVHHSQGDRLENDAMEAMALHEIGHLLGLDHTGDTLSVMAARVRVRELSDADRATARLLYALPTGSLR